MAHRCEECGTSFLKLSQLKQHQRTENHWKKCVCQLCGKSFTRKDNLDRHLEKHQASTSMHCEECGKCFSRPDNLHRHLKEKHQRGGGKKRPSSNHQEDGPVKRLKKFGDPRQYYTFTKIKEQTIEKFNTTASSYKVNFKDIEVSDDVLTFLRTLFNALFEDLTRGSKTEDLVRLTVQSPSLDYPIVIPFLKLLYLTADRFMAEIERVLQSNEDFVIDSGLIIEVTLVDMPNGGAQKRCKFVNIDKFLESKKCFIRIQNHDDLCCARAIVTAKARLDKHEKWNTIRQGRPIQLQMAKELHQQAGVAIGQCGIDEVKKFQDALIEYQIHVVSRDHFNAIIYAGPETEKKIYLYYHDEHYDVITSMSGFLSRNYYCTNCNKGYDHKEDHRCNNVCHACRKVHKDSDQKWIHCDECHRFFRGHECFNLHTKTTLKGNSTCKSIYRCTDCRKTVNKNLDSNHQCGQTYCSVCQEFYPDGHKCYMMPEEPCQPNMTIEEELIDEEANSKTFIFFDFECTQDDFVECEQRFKPDVFGRCKNCLKANCGSYEHKPNLCVAQKVCTICMDETDACNMCGQREYVFSGENTLDLFCQWLFSEENYDSTVLCHNFQGYDSYPILQYLYKNAIMPKIIPSGAKIMSLTVDICKIKMIDSINFLPMALSKLPSMFGFEELKKGYFPHLFNRKENQTVVLDRLPNLVYYNPDAMKPRDRDAFLIWYNDHKHDIFDFQKELLAYCQSDVDILRRCSLKFREDFIETTGIDPYDRCLTLASSVNLVFRTCFLEQDTIALIPHHGYNPQQNQSVKALQWIKYLSHIQGHKSLHARNGGEKTIGPYRVDGYYETKDGQRVVLEFHGDFWHGNPNKYSKFTVNPVNHKTMGDLYEATMKKSSI